MTLQEVYAKFTIGSQGFVRAVSDNCGYNASNSEIERIAAVAPTSEKFQSVWENDDCWTDEKNGDDK